MKKAYKILRTVVVSLIVLAFFIPAALYVALSLPPVQRFLCHTAETELSKLLTVPVNIDYVSISPFNRLTLHGVKVADAANRDALLVHRLGAGVNLWSLLSDRRLVVDYAEIIGLDATIYRDSVGAPLNIRPIIDALSPKSDTGNPTRFDFRINTVVMRTSSLSYDVLSLPRTDSGFDPNHIAISDMRADIQLPEIRNGHFTVDIRRIAFSERSGFVLKSLTGLFRLTPDSLSVSNLTINLPNTRLAFNNQACPIDGLRNLNRQWHSLPFDIHLLDGSFLSTADISPFLPALNVLNLSLDAHLHLRGTPGHIQLERLALANSDFKLLTYGSLTGLGQSSPLEFSVPGLSVEANSSRLVDVASRFSNLPPRSRTILANLGNIRLDATAKGSSRHGDISMTLSCDAGSSAADCSYNLSPAGSPNRRMRLRGHLDIDRFRGDILCANLTSQIAQLTEASATADFDITATPQKLLTASARMEIPSATFQNRQFSNLTADFQKDGSDYHAAIFINNAMLFADIDANATLTPSDKSLRLKASVRDASPAMLGFGNASADNRLSFSANADLCGRTLDDVLGFLDIRDFRMEQPDRPDFFIPSLSLRSTHGEDADSLILTTPLADITATGTYHLTTLPKVARTIFALTLPALASPDATVSVPDDFWTRTTNVNNFSFRADIKTLEPLEPIAKIPVRIVDGAIIDGFFDGPRRRASVTLSAPYLLQGKKIIENTALQASIMPVPGQDNANSAHLDFTTTMPTKKGPMTITASSQAIDNRIDSRFRWKIRHDRDFSGNLNLTAAFSRNSDRQLVTALHVNPGRLVFNDTIWTVDPSLITLEGNRFEVDHFKAWRDRQFIALNGAVSPSAADTLTLTLDDINLDYVFETLDIPTAMFGGNATGVIYASQLLTRTPKAFTPALEVKSLTYNHALLGDAIIRSGWNNDTKAIALNVDVTQPNSRHTFVDGHISPMDESLDLTFRADSLAIGFLQPYMSAFCDDISGFASGEARLYGTFKLIDLVGDVYGEDVCLKLGITNTSYLTSDSIHFTPGRIDLDNLTIRDIYGHTARLNGFVTHKCFKEPEFNFRVSDARDMLVYDVAESPEFPWYGRVFGTGSANITGVPGTVDINVNMTTARGSAFTYILSDALSAQEYTFITFRDRDRHRKDSIAAIAAPPKAVRDIRRQLALEALQGPPSNYRLDFNIDITPQALITLVMDPVGGDRVRCHGSGMLRMVYDSANEDLRMNGTYTLDNGKYNFTLQDIIIKEFSIEEGSSIAFNGDPYAAQLNLTAKYQLKGNLSDLDESFLEDKELNRTNVPVDALLLVKGDMRQPDISFDLDFPTITEESKRKIRSIINTDEMMNRQIIYLLALNRFYTPDYMNATRGNEFMSVASSTISSQLSNILGQLSDNWAIAPNFRSDRGDFSDVEFDLALSSHLLNNRLLFNGNLGYRDKSLNNNSFIGDFDIEYLLNRSGSLRLKAYNRYNDQNYYLKSALTTQGVGIVFKRDFDNIFSFLHPLRRHKKHTADTLPAPQRPEPSTAPQPLNAPDAPQPLNPATTPHPQNSSPAPQPLNTPADSSDPDFITFRRRN